MINTNTASSYITVDDINTLLALWDTVTQEEYDRLRPLVYPGTNIFLICFPVTSIHTMDSFNTIRDKWIPEIQLHCPDIPYVLVGTKIDLRGESSDAPFFTVSAGREIAEKLGALDYFECSSLTQEGLGDTFENAARILLKERGERRREEGCLGGWCVIS